MRLVLAMLAVGALVFAVACGDDDDEDQCVSGCEKTMAANCDNGPASQQICEADCNTMLAGMCGAQYQALLNCFGGQVTCDASGFPVVVGCETEQGAFNACLNQT